MPDSPKNDISPKVLITEKLSPDGVAMLRTVLDVHERKGLSPDELLQAIPEYDALLVRSETKVTAQLLQAAKKLKVVGRAGVGVDNIDVEAATKLGIVVINSPAGNIAAAAEHTIALMMSMARKIPEGSSSLKSGKWERSKFVGVEVNGKTLGIIGLGKVGMIVARSAKGLGMKILAVDPYASAAVAQSASVTLAPSLAEMLPSVDFLTIHTPLIASTRGMISTKELAQMKKGARILNVARGGTIDEEALLQALESGHIAGAAVDVFTSEPPTENSSASKLIAHPNVVATPHLGASTFEAQENVSIDVCEQVLQILQGSLPRSAVNAPLILPEEYKKLQPFVHLVEKMGSLFTQHYTSASLGGLNRNHFELIYHGEVANINNTKPLFAALIKGLTTPISNPGDTNVTIVNATLIAKERGIVVNEQFSRDPSSPTSYYSSLITLIAKPPSRSSSRAPASTPAPLQPLQPQPPSSPSLPSSGRAAGEKRQSQHQIISGTCSGTQAFITRLDRFETSFVPDGTMVICHNYDSPGKIGAVGSILGRSNVNINFMSVAPVSKTLIVAGDGSQDVPDVDPENEALMILGIDSVVSDEVIHSLAGSGGILNASVVRL